MEAIFLRSFSPHSGNDAATAKKTVSARVARWFVFKPKIQSWVNLG
jgi:hypothetical protein